jgi:hypothetical protein
LSVIDGQGPLSADMLMMNDSVIAAGYPHIPAGTLQSTSFETSNGGANALAVCGDSGG